VCYYLVRKPRAGLYCEIPRRESNVYVSSSLDDSGDPIIRRLTHSHKLLTTSLRQGYCGLQNTALTPDQEQIVTGCRFRSRNALISPKNFYIDIILYMDN
jgi:hypothetical protein